MIPYKRGDVVLVRFVFSDETGAKVRPAAVVSTAPYHRGRQEIIVAAVTSNVDRRLFGDSNLADWRQAGLLSPSLATGILRTIKQSMVGRKLGALSVSDQESVDGQLRRCLGV